MKFVGISIVLLCLCFIGFSYGSYETRTIQNEFKKNPNDFEVIGVITSIVSISRMGIVIEVNETRIAIKYWGNKHCEEQWILLFWKARSVYVAIPSL